MGLVNMGDRNDLERLQNLPEYPRFDRDVSDFRNFLDEWVAKRNADGGVLAYFRRVPQIA